LRNNLLNLVIGETKKKMKKIKVSLSLKPKYCNQSTLMKATFRLAHRNGGKKTVNSVQRCHSGEAISQHSVKVIVSDGTKRTKKNT